MSIDAVTPVGIAPVKAPAKPATGTDVKPTTEAAPKAAADSVAPINPRLRYDPTSGVVVTEFLDSSGTVQTQAPSTAVLAYLRAGLTEDGLGKKDETEAKA